MNTFATIKLNGKTFLANLNQAIDLSIPLNRGAANPNAFYIPQPRFEPIRVGDFVGSVKDGGSANCENLFINAHGNGTHTECIGHISRERYTINQQLKQFFFTSFLLSVQPKEQENGIPLICKDQVIPFIPDGIEALIIRSLPNSVDKLQKNYSGQPTPCLEPALAAALADKGISQLLVDLPSVDPEEDNGLLAAHKAFWQYPETPRMNACISELIYVPNHVSDGLYLLNIQIASIESDASPSKPLLYSLVEQP